MRKDVEREAFERCVARATLRLGDFTMEDVVEAHVVGGATVQLHTITVTYAPTRISRTYRSGHPSGWSGRFRQDLDDGLFY